MASEIRVDKINSLSGVGTVTLSPTGVDISGITTVSTLKVGTGVTASEDGDIFFTGIATATTFSGSGASLTALPAAQVTGTLPAISGANLTALNGSNIASGTVADARISTLTASKLSGALPAISALNLTNVPAANVVGVHTSLNITGSTTVGGGVTISESGIEASGIGITCANINGAQIGGRRNVIINGAMQVAQRGTSSSTVGYQTVDRIYQGFANTDENPVQTQHTLTSSDTGPYEEGFRKSFHVQNGNQTGGAGAADEIATTYNVEAQDLAQSGWDYTSSSSNITISFWVKSSVAQQFQVNMRLYPASGDQKELCFEYTPSANTWTKVTKTISGASGNVLRNTNELGMFIMFAQFYGTNYTANSRPFDTWETKNNNQNYKDYATTWYTTNNATWEITGLQLEVGSQATPFEHRSFAEELRLCQRYYYQSSGSIVGMFIADAADGAQSYGFLRFPVAMRATPTIVLRDNNGNTNGRVTQHGVAHDIAATALQAQTEGFAKVMKTSGNWNLTAARPIVAGITSADAEL